MWDLRCGGKRGSGDWRTRLGTVRGLRDISVRTGFAQTLTCTGESDLERLRPLDGVVEKEVCQERTKTLREGIGETNLEGTGETPEEKGKTSGDFRTTGDPRKELKVREDPTGVSEGW